MIGPLTSSTHARLAPQHREGKPGEILAGEPCECVVFGGPGPNFPSCYWAAMRTVLNVYTAWHLVVWYLHRCLHSLPVASYPKYQPASNGLNPQGALRNINNGLRTITDSPSPPPSSSLIHRPCCSHPPLTGAFGLSTRRCVAVSALLDEETSLLAGNKSWSCCCLGHLRHFVQRVT